MKLNPITYVKVAAIECWIVQVPLDAPNIIIAKVSPLSLAMLCYSTDSALLQTPPMYIPCFLQEVALPFPLLSLWFYLSSVNFLVSKSQMHAKKRLISED